MSGGGYCSRARKARFAVIVSLVVMGASELRAAETGLIARWQLDASRVRGNTFPPLAGPLSATVVGPVRFSKDAPRALLVDGNSKAGHRVGITDDIAAARLPTKAITAEAWVRLDKTGDWGGFVCALQDNGNYERGWLLGSRKARFCFAVATAKAGRLTYLTAPQPLQRGYWYHVAGTYDGRRQKLYVDGRLAARSDAQQGPILYPPRAFYTLAAYRDDNEIHSMAGRIERVSVYDRALTAAEVRGLFNARRKLFPDIEPARPDVVTDWPTYLRDNQRSGTAPGPLRLPLHPRWVHRARHAPRPAWPPPARQDYWHKRFDLRPLVVYDRAFHVVTVGDAVFFGSSADDKVYCLDARTGRTRWSFFTEGPVRLAPTVADGKILFGSDDGWVYCLRAADGSLLWKYRAAPEERRIPGNERIISTWPVRTGVLVTDDVAHFCAGLFPEQGVYRAAVDVRTGGKIAVERIDASTQGYLVRRYGRLSSPTGRSAKKAVLSKRDRRGKDPTAPLPILEYPYSRITAGETDILGGDGKVAAFSAEDGRAIWSARVEGRAYSLAAARGRLLVATDEGCIYCFTPEAAPPAAAKPPGPAEPDPGAAAGRRRCAEAAERIVQTAGVSRGYCLVLGAGGLLARELAGRTEMRIVLREPDAKKVAAARDLLDAAGLYGSRVVVHHGRPDKLPYADGLFNLVARDPLAGKLPLSRQEALRVLRPGRGAAFLDDGLREAVRRKLPDGADSRRLGVFLDCGSMAVDDELLYVAVQEKCLALDVRDGRRRLAHTMPQCVPGEKRLWGYLARADDLVVASGRKAKATYTETSWDADNALWYDNMKLVTSDYLFAIDARRGTSRWTYRSGVVVNTSIAVGGGRVYFVESHAPAALADPLGRMTMRTFLPGPNYLVALDLKTGRVAWKRELDLSNCQHIVYLSYADGMLVLSGNRYVDKRLWYWVYGIDAATGTDRWQRSHNTGFKPKGGHGEQNRHPTIVGDTVYAWPLAYKLHTGEPVKGWRFSRHGHGCGNLSASAHCLFWRGANPWMWDLRPDGGARRLNAVSRPGCFINIIPAAGLVLVPEASSGCTCDYPMQTSMAFSPVKANAAGKPAR